MKFKLQAAALNEALSVVSIVPPRPITPQGGAGYLFVVEDGTCQIYSRDSLHQARAEVKITDADADGSFVYPSDKISSLKYVDGWIEFESGHDEEEDRFWVNYVTEGGAHAERASFDPRLIQSLDEALAKAGDEFVFPAAVFREGLNIVRGYLSKPNNDRVDDSFKTLQVYADGKGDGHMFAADGIRCCYAFCSAFEGKGLSIHGQHLPFLMAFLGKSTGDITVKMGDGATYAINDSGQVLGWAHHVKKHGKFKYYPFKADGFVLKVPKDLLVRVLRHVRNELDGRKNKTRITYDHEPKTLQFQASEATGKASSIPVGVSPVDLGEQGGGGKAATEDFAHNINIDQIIDLVDPMRSHEVSLRVAPYKDEGSGKMAALIRTYEEFLMNDAGKILISSDDEAEGKVHQWRVTRFMPSKD